MRTALSKKDIEAMKQVKTEGAVKPERAVKAEGAASTEAQSYTEQIVKYIPAEVVAFYIPALGAAAALKQTSGGTQSTSYGFVVGAIFLLATVGTFLYMYKNAKAELEEKRVDYAGQRSFLKAGLSVIAFLIWALYLGGPFAGIEGYATYGTLAIFGFTFFTPAIYDAIPIPFSSRKPKETVPPPQTVQQKPVESPPVQTPPV